MATLLADTRTQIAGCIQAALPSLKTCLPHGGSFDRAELLRWGVKSPAVLVAITGTGDARIGQGVEFPVSYVLYVITRDTAAIQRDAMAINLVQAIHCLLPGQIWESESLQGDNPFLAEPEAISSQNLFNTALDSEGVAIWAIAFRQAVSLGDVTGSDLSALDDFIRYSGEATNAEDAVLMETYGEFEVLEADGQRITEEENPLITAEGYYREVEQ